MAKKQRTQRPDGLTGKKIPGFKDLRVECSFQVTPDHKATVIGKSKTASGFRLDIRVDNGWMTSLYTTPDGWIFETPQPPLSDQTEELEPAYG